MRSRSHSLRAAPFFVARAPLLPDDFFRPQDGARALEDRWRDLEAVLRQPAVATAIEAASPSLAAALQGEARRDRTSVLLAAARYVARMRGRATPFRLCASVVRGPVAERSEAIVLGPIEECERVARLDVSVLAGLLRDQRPAADVMLRASGEVLRLPDVLKIGRLNATGEASSIHVTRTEALDRVLGLASAPIAREALVAALADVEEDRDAREAFVDALAAESILVVAETPPLTGEDELSTLAHLPSLRALVDDARSVRRRPLLAPIADLRALEVKLAPFVGTDKQPAVVHDLARARQEGAIGRDVVSELGLILDVLARTTEPIDDRRYADFVSFFERRYERRWVPLVEALDSERGFHFPVSARYGASDPKAAAAVHRFRLELLAAALRGGSGEVAIEEATLPLSRDRARPLPSRFAVRFMLVEGPNGLSIHEPVPVRAPGTALFARTTAFDPKLREQARAWLAEDAGGSPDADSPMVADLAYFVPGRTAAFVQFPSLSPYEIVLTSVGGRGTSQSIDVNDVWVSVRAGQVALLHGPTGRRVVVRVTGAANFDRSDVSPLARFLARIPEAEHVPACFSWGDLDGMPFLPRVTFGRHVLHPRTWNLGPHDTAPLRDSRSLEARVGSAMELRDRLGLPRDVLFSERVDHLLPVDLSDPLSVAAWIDIAAERMTLLEATPAERAFVRDARGRYHHEIVVPLRPAPVRARQESGETERPRVNLAEPFDRISPGGNVLYLKMYGDRDELIGILSHALYGLVDDARRNRRIARWFFLPYSDPDPHIRVRIIGEPAVLYGEVLPALHAALALHVHRRTIHAVTLDTYDREVQRYGGAATMDRVEDVFMASSDAAIVAHGALEGHATDDRAVVLELVRSLHAFVEVMDLPPRAAHELARATALAYDRTEGADGRVRAGALYRKELSTLRLAPAKELLGAEEERFFRAAWSRLATHVEDGGSSVPLARIARDCLHVHAIRVCTTWPAAPWVESVAHRFLEKVLAARAARAA